MGADNGMDVSPSWQELKDERDALLADKRMAEWRDQRWRTQILAKECKKLKSERDALAAHFDSIITPFTLARLKAEWQADALLAAAPEMLDDRDRQRLERFASAVIRHQTEEARDE